METPQQKAKELVEKYFLELPQWVNIDDAKKCAIITVDTILIDCGAKDWSGDVACDGKNYWQSVKSEIEKI